MSKLEKDICNLLEQKENFVHAMILSQLGSTPRTSGAKMLIRQDGSIIGTIGGGLVEADVIKAAGELFNGPHARIRAFNLNAPAQVESMDMICGGQMVVLLEFMEATPTNIKVFKNLLSSLEKGHKSFIVAELEEMGADEIKRVDRILVNSDGTVVGEPGFPLSFIEIFKTQIYRQRAPVLVSVENRRFLLEPTFVPGTVFLFGAGHVSQQVALLTNRVDFRTVVLDDRKEFANRERFRNADEVHVLASFNTAFADLEIDRDSYVVIVTRGHRYDKTVLAQALKTEAGYIGMIGSHRKRDAIYNALLSEGFTKEDLKRVYAPIGLEIAAETPEEIAVSIVGELIAKRAG